MWRKEHNNHNYGKIHSYNFPLNDDIETSKRAYKLEHEYNKTMRHIESITEKFKYSIVDTTILQCALELA